jgi:hypothetical protein
MPANLAELLKLGQGARPGQSPPVPGSMPTKPGGGALGNISNMMNTMPASGIKGLGASMTAIIIKGLEFLLVAYGTNSQEGGNILKAIKNLSSISKGQQTGDATSIVRSLISALPPNMQNIKPGDLVSAISELTGKGGAPADSPGAGAPMPMPPGGMARPM